jgi:hypothetical protein
MLTLIIEHAKNVAAVLGVGGVLFSAYATAGLPVPASQAFVKSEVGLVVTKIEASDVATARKIDGLAATTLELLRKGIVQSKARLRFELAANASLLPKADPSRRVTLERRASEIEDEIRDLDRDDTNLRDRIERLKAP